MKTMKWLVLAAFALGVNNVAIADDDDDNDGACPANISAAADTTYGVGAADVTRCLENRKKVKLVVQINKSCRDSYVHNGQVKNSAAPWDHPVAPVKCQSTRAYALGNMINMIKDYEAHGMVAGEDFEMIAVVHSGGGFQLLTNPNKNQFQGLVTTLMGKGVKFYFCQNTVKGFIARNHIAAPTDDVSVLDQLVPGTEFVTAGLTAIADFQEEGYIYVQP